MHDAPDIAAMAQHHRQLADDMLRQAHLVTADRDEQAAVLITAATVLIERLVGPVLAPAALMALIEPTLADWRLHVAVPARQA